MRFTLTPPLSSPFSEFYLGLNLEQRQKFARAVGTTERYLTYKLVIGERMPSREMIAAIARASEKFGYDFSREELFAYFDAITVKVQRKRDRNKRQQEREPA